MANIITKDGKITTNENLDWLLEIIETTPSQFFIVNEEYTKTYVEDEEKGFKQIKGFRKTAVNKNQVIQIF